MSSHVIGVGPENVNGFVIGRSAARNFRLDSGVRGKLGENLVTLVFKVGTTVNVFDATGVAGEM